MSDVVIEHAEGGKYLSPYGWVPSPEQGFRFTSTHEASMHLEIIKATAAGHRVVPAEFKEDVSGNVLRNVATDYDPFGINRR